MEDFKAAGLCDQLDEYDAARIVSSLSSGESIISQTRKGVPTPKFGTKI